jgi:hypothetical protein
MSFSKLNMVMFRVRCWPQVKWFCYSLCYLLPAAGITGRVGEPADSAADCCHSRTIGAAGAAGGRRPPADLMLHLLAGLIWGKHDKEEAVIDVLPRRLWLLYCRGGCD